MPEYMICTFLGFETFGAARQLQPALDSRGPTDLDVNVGLIPLLGRVVELAKLSLDAVPATGGQRQCPSLGVGA